MHCRDAKFICVAIQYFCRLAEKCIQQVLYKFMAPYPLCLEAMEKMWL
jgi:hypothetical protein